MEFGTHSEWQIFDGKGRRKYLTEKEQDRLLAAAEKARPDIRALCNVLVHTGSRISEALALTPEHHDTEAKTLVLRTLKRRKTCFREVPIPSYVSEMLVPLATGSARYWPIHRATALRHLKRLYDEIGLSGPMACCRGLRHGYGIVAASKYVPPNLIQRFMGHALPTTTAIYLDAVGPEERQFARRMWKSD